MQTGSHRYCVRPQAYLAVGLTVAFSILACSSSTQTQDTAAAFRSSSGSFLTPPSDGNDQKTVTIKQGDQVEMTVWGYSEFDTKSVVNIEGVITVPLIGEVKAEGKTKSQLVESLRARLIEYVQGDPKITVTVTPVSSQRISVLGAVTRQDNYPVLSEVSLIEILSTAGGTTPEADLHYVKILRPGLDDPLIINLALYMESGQAEAIPKIRPGDTVFVPKKENFVRQFADFLRDAVLVFGFFRVFY